MRALVLTVIVLGLIPASFLRPWIGVLGWSWIAFMAPHRLAWGFISTAPVAWLIAVPTLLGLVFTRDRKPLPSMPEVWLLGLFAVHVTGTTFLALHPDLAWGKFDLIFKSLLMTFVTMTLFQDRVRVRWLYLLMALSLGFYGLKGGVWALLTGAEHRVWGPQDSFFGDNNTLALALCMDLPLLLGLARHESRRWLKLLLRVMFAATVIAILFTYSRGGVVGLVTVLSVLAWRSPWRLRFLVAMIAAFVLAAPFIPDRWWERVESMTLYQGDPSVVGRFEAWQTGFNLAANRPLAGGGFRVYWHDATWEQYSGREFSMARDAHSLYFEVLGEHGFLGLAIYLSLLASVVISLRRIRKRWRRDSERRWLATYAEMTELSLFPFLTAGAFLGVAYFEFYFQLVALTVMLKVLHEKALAGERRSGPMAAPRQERPSLPPSSRRPALPRGATP